MLYRNHIRDATVMQPAVWCKKGLAEKGRGVERRGEERREEKIGRSVLNAQICVHPAILTLCSMRS